MKKTLIAAGAVALLGAPTAASAHVTVNPRAVAAGSFQVLTVRVPNERDTKGTVKVDLRLPDGFYSLSYKKVPGWKAKITKRQLEQPVDLGEFEADERITRVVWTGNPKRGGIVKPGQFEEFPISVRIPDGDAGSQLAFRAYQTYRGGERVAWAGPAGSDTPAPRVTLTAPPASAAWAPQNR